MRMFEKKYEEAERRSATMAAEMDRLNGLLKNKTQEIDDFRTRYSKLETTIIQYKTIESKVQDYERNFAIMTQEM